MLLYLVVAEKRSVNKLLQKNPNYTIGDNMKVIVSYCYLYSNQLETTVIQLVFSSVKFFGLLMGPELGKKLGSLCCLENKEYKKINIQNTVQLKNSTCFFVQFPFFHAICIPHSRQTINKNTHTPRKSPNQTHNC